MQNTLNSGLGEALSELPDKWKVLPLGLALAPRP